MSVATSTALLIAGGIGAAGSVGSALIGSSAAKSAANTQAAAGQKAADLAQAAGDTANTKIGDVLSQQQQLLSPYAAQTTSGLAALTAALAPGGSLSQQFSYNPADVANDPAYQFQLAQGLQSVKRAQAATGTLASGGAAKALEQYAAGVTASYENQDYNQALSTYGTNRNTNLGNIQSQLQLGQYGTSGLLSALQNYGNLFSSNTIGTAQNVGNDLTGKANAQAAGIVGQANAQTGALGGLANIAQQLGFYASPSSTALPADPGAQTALDAYAGSQRAATNTNALNATAPSAFTNLSAYASPAAYGTPTYPGSYSPYGAY